MKTREKLLSVGAVALTDSELIAVLLQTGIPLKNVMSLAKKLLGQMGSLPAVLSASFIQISKTLKVGSLSTPLFKLHWKLAGAQPAISL